MTKDEGFVEDGRKGKQAAVRLGQLPRRNELGQDGVPALRGRFCIMRETTYGCRSDLLHCYSRVFARSWKERLRFRMYISLASVLLLLLTFKYVHNPNTRSNFSFDKLIST